MAKSLSVYDAKNNFSKLINEIVEDENKEIIIERYNKPVAKIISYKEEKKDRIPGLAKKYKGKIDYKKSEEMDQEIEAEFEESR